MRGVFVWGYDAMATMPTPLWIALITGAGLAVILITWAWLGKRVDTHPICRKCRYDLYGLSSPTECPECGQKLTTTRAIRLGRRKKRWLTLALGFTLLASATGVFTPAARGWVDSVDWIRVKPLWWLKIDATKPDWEFAEDARTEILRRMQDQELSANQVKGAVRLALDVQGDLSTEWAPMWAEIIELAWFREQLTQVQLDRYLEQMFGDRFIIGTRDPMREGTRLLWSYRPVLPRCPWESDFGFMVDLERIEFVDWTGLPRTPYRTRLLYKADNPSQAPLRSGRISFGSGQVYPKPPAGIHDLRLTIRCALLTRDDAEALDRRRRAGEAIKVPLESCILTEFTTTAVRRVEVVPRDVQVIELVHDEELAAKIHSLISVSDCRIAISRKRYTGSLSVDVPRLPIDIAFEVFVRSNGQEGFAGRLRVRADERRHQPISGAWFADEEPKITTDTTHVDIVMRPAIWLAESLFGHDRICGSEIVYEDIPVFVKDER